MGSGDCYWNPRNLSFLVVREVSVPCPPFVSAGPCGLRLQLLRSDTISAQAAEDTALSPPAAVQTIESQVTGPSWGSWWYWFQNDLRKRGEGHSPQRRGPKQKQTGPPEAPLILLGKKNQCISHEEAVAKAQMRKLALAPGCGRDRHMMGPRRDVWRRTASTTCVLGQQRRPQRAADGLLWRLQKRQT